MTTSLLRIPGNPGILSHSWCFCCSGRNPSNTRTTVPEFQGFSLISHWALAQLLLWEHQITLKKPGKELIPVFAAFPGVCCVWPWSRRAKNPQGMQSPGWWCLWSFPFQRLGFPRGPEIHGMNFPDWAQSAEFSTVFPGAQAQLLPIMVWRRTWGRGGGKPGIKHGNNCGDPGLGFWDGEAEFWFLRPCLLQVFMLIFLEPFPQIHGRLEW